MTKKICTILGIDPGSHRTGYGIIRTDGQSLLHVAHGVVRVPKTDLVEQLALIFREITAITQAHQPEEAAIEQVFMSKNAHSALKLGQARGAAIAAMGSIGLSVSEYSARFIKKSIVGYGAAAKDQMQYMVKLLLNLKLEPAVDAADALAIAICHAQCRGMNKKIQQIKDQIT